MTKPKRVRSDKAVIIRLPDGRRFRRGCQTNDDARYRLICKWVLDMKKGEYGGLEVLTHIIDKNVPLGEAYDRRDDPAKVISLGGQKNIEPLVSEWHKAKQRAAKGAAMADVYLGQVRRLIKAGQPFMLSRFTAAVIKAHLLSLTIDCEGSRNRHKAAFSSFAAWLVEHGHLQRNIVHDIPGWAESKPRNKGYTMEQAEKLMHALRKRRNRGASLVELRAAFALAVGAGCERAVLEKLRVRDVDFQFDPVTDQYLDGIVNAEGTKNEYRDRESRVMWEWCARAIREAMKDKLPDALLVGSAVRDRHTLNDTIKRAARDLGLPYYSLHGQRHTHATLMLKQGERHNVVAHQLGHGNAWQVITRYGKYKVSKDDYRKLGGKAPTPTPPTDTPQVLEPTIRLAK